MTPRRRAAALGLLLGALAAALAGGRLSARPAGSATVSGGAAAGSLATLDPFSAYQRGRALGESGRFLASLPYFRRALAVPPDSWRPYADFAISLFQATHEVETRRGVTRPVTRSSDQRVALMREALHALDRAEADAGTPADSASVIARRARYLAVWGLSWDAVSEYTRAGGLDPARLEDAVRLFAELRDPALAAEPHAGDGE